MANSTTPPTVPLVQRLEQAQQLDPVVRAVRPVEDFLVGSPGRRDALRGAWLGHAVHPPLTDVPLGFWTSALVLDLVGGKAAQGASQRLLLLGLVAFAPTAWTGWAELAGTGEREQRVGVVHASAMGTAAALMALSWKARRAGRQWRGKGLALLGAATMTAGGYLGGHLATTRGVGSSHPDFDEAPVAG